MTEISPLRTSGRPRPLDDMKDLHATQRSGSSPRATSEGAENGLRVRSSKARKMREVQEGLRQAALINIVASVNDEDNALSPRMSESGLSSADVQNFGNTVSVLSNLVLTKDRTISIPKPQSFEDPPEKFSKKKPVFYKHSTDEVDNNEAETRRRYVSLTRTRTNLNEEREVKKSVPKNESIRISVSLQQLNEDTESANETSRQWFASPAKVKIARSMTPRRRRLTAINRKGEARATLSKCEAVDILDTTETLQQRLKTPSSTSAKDFGKERVDLLTEDVNIYRAKSLPALFPVKRKKEVTQLNTMTDKTKLIAPFKRPSVRAYGTTPNALQVKTMQTKTDEQETLSVNNTKLLTQPEKVTPAQDADSKSDNEPKENPMSLEGRSIPNPNTRQQFLFPDEDSGLGTAKDVGEVASKVDTSTTSKQEQEIWRDLGRQFDALQKKIAVKVPHTENKPKTMNSDSNSVDIAGYGLVGRGFKSNLSSARSRADRQSRQSKRVTFAEGSECENGAPRTIWNSFPSKMSNNASLNASLRKNGQAGQSRTLPSNKGITSEIVKLKKRILPAPPNAPSKPRYEVSDDVKISKYKTGTEERERPPPRPPSRMSVFSDASSFYGDFSVHGKETDYTDRGCSSKAKSFGMSSFYPDPMTQKIRLGDYLGDSDSDLDSDSDYVRNDVSVGSGYRVVKAVDLGSLSGFQHRKFRKPATAPETTTTHFVKIKLK